MRLDVLIYHRKRDRDEKDREQFQKTEAAIFTNTSCDVL